MTKETDFSKITIKDIPFSVIKKIQLDDIHAFIAYMAREQETKPSTRARKISTIRIFFRYLNQKKDSTYTIKTNPAQNLETPKLGKRQPKYLNLDDSKKLLKTTDNSKNRNYKRDYAILTILLNCGLRLSELVGINIGDIDFSEYKLTVIGKGNKERTIYLNQACINAINDYLAVRPKTGIKVDKLNSQKALFLSERKERISRRTTLNYAILQQR